MAAAQARAAWQRIANRILVQDDAKRAPKFSALSPSGLIPLSDPAITSYAQDSYQPVSNRNLANSTLHLKRKLDTLAKETVAMGADDALLEPSHWEPSLGSEKVEPWWRLAGKEELTLFVMQKASEKVENCDLPRPQTVLFYGDPPSKTELLAALRFSQTRAREAETAARRARRDKERVVNLVFKQASVALAFKLWIQMLQTERLLLRRNIEEQEVLLPRRHRSREGEVPAPWLAVGLVLVGAGILLGWLFSSSPF